MMARGQRIVPGAPLQTLFQQGLADTAPWLPEPTPPSEVDCVVPLNTRMCRFGILVSFSAKLPCVDCDISCDECQALGCFADGQ